MYIHRLLTDTLQKALKSFPAVLMTGPRQAGKTTVLQNELALQYSYTSFDDPLERSFAHTDPQGFLKKISKPAILDEIQYVPELLPYLKMHIDQNRSQSGQWILTGSQQFQLMQNVSESLAGRIAILELLPFSTLEIPTPSDLTTAVWYGGYPELALDHSKRDIWLSSYVQTYLERDLRQLQNIHDLRAFELFTTLIAARHGQLFNAAELGRESGISAPTIKSWAGALQASYLIHLLPPYYKNYGKRLIKNSKIYFIDSALACFLTRQATPETALSSIFGGPLFEGFIISETLKVFTSLGKKPDIFFWRSHDGLEVDLIIPIANKLYPIEIKLTATPTLQHGAALTKFKNLVKKEASDIGLLVCRVEHEMHLPNSNLALPWQQFTAWLRDKLSNS